MSKCLGCGIKLQNIDSNIEGYVINIDSNICERCFKLKNYGEYKITNKTNEDYLNILKNIDNNSLVIYVTSILDLNIDYLNIFKNVILVIHSKQQPALWWLQDNPFPVLPAQRKLHGPQSALRMPLCQRRC